MSLYAEYVIEKTSDSIIEREWGFATYRYLNEGKSVYIVDIYISPDARKVGHASLLADIIADMAKAKGAVEMIGTVIPSNKDSSASIDVLRAYGMELKSASQDLIVFRKDL